MKVPCFTGSTAEGLPIQDAEHNAGSVKDSLQTFSHINRLRTAIAAKKRQADAYLQTYGGRMAPGELPFFHSFLRKRSGPAFYWQYRKLLHPFFRLAGMMLLG